MKKKLCVIILICSVILSCSIISNNKNTKVAEGKEPLIIDRSSTSGYLV